MSESLNNNSTSVETTSNVPNVTATIKNDSVMLCYVIETDKI